MSAASGRRRVLRRTFAAAAGLMLSACDRLSQNESFVKVLKSAESLNRMVQQGIAGRRAMAQEFTPADVQKIFRSNGTRLPAGVAYKALLDGGFAAWKLQVGGMVEAPASYTLAELRALPSRTQITRHDCVEGWSCIGEWKGVQLGRVLDQVKPQAGARYVVFHCADAMDEGNPGSFYYESIDLDDAYHPQTLLAYDLNGAPVPVGNGAPLRARIERQLGYKHAKYLMRIDLVASLEGLRGGQGGYWEDQGYEWYAGI